MAIHVVCPGCHASFKVSDQYAGRKGPCPKCKVQITIPKKEDEVIIEAPEEFEGTKDNAGKLVLKPITREKSTFSLVMLVGVLGGTILIGLTAFLLRPGSESEEVSPILLAVGAIALAPPIVLGGYSILRDSELEPYRGSSLMIRTAVCALVYAGLWGLYAATRSFLELNAPPEIWELAFFIPPLALIGSITALASLDLEMLNGFFHYSFYLAVTVLLRLILGMTPF